MPNRRSIRRNLEIISSECFKKWQAESMARHINYLTSSFCTEYCGSEKKGDRE